VSTAAAALEDCRRYRSLANIQTIDLSSARSLVGIGFSYAGPLKLTPGAVNLPSEAFRQGLAARSAFLGDPTSQGDEGNPSNWKVGGPGHDLDALIVVAGNSRETVDERSER
jgi:hypothetical protein